jgi:hypothetical protein
MRFFQEMKINQIFISDDKRLSIKQSLTRQVNIDKLILSCRVSGRNCPPFNDDFLAQLHSLGFKSRWIPDGRYDDSCALSFGRINITLARKPRWPSFATYSVQLNPSYFLDFQQLTKFLSLAMPGFDPHQTRITALDVAVDFGEPISSFRKRLQISGYQRLEIKYSREQTINLYVGNNPLFRLYDKGEELRQGKEWLTRLEIHTEGTQVPIRIYNDLHSLVRLNPFKRVRLVDLTVPKLKSKVLNDFWAYYTRRGYEPAHFEFRRFRNYQRDIGRHLNELKIQTLNSLVVEGFKAFFESSCSLSSGVN